MDDTADVLLKLLFLPSAGELRPEWFSGKAEEPKNIRAADELLVDLLFAANGETFESLQPYVRTLNVGGLGLQRIRGR